MSYLEWQNFTEIHKLNSWTFGSRQNWLDSLTIYCRYDSFYICSHIVSGGRKEEKKKIFKIQWNCLKDPSISFISCSITHHQVSNMVSCAADSLNVSSFKCDDFRMKLDQYINSNTWKRHDWSSKNAVVLKLLYWDFWNSNEQDMHFLFKEEIKKE